jgi:hypothetical protein
LKPGTHNIRMAIRLCNSGGIPISGVMAERRVAELLEMEERLKVARSVLQRMTEIAVGDRFDAATIALEALKFEDERERTTTLEWTVEDHVADRHGDLPEWMISWTGANEARADKVMRLVLDHHSEVDCVRKIRTITIREVRGEKRSDGDTTAK